MNKIILPIGLVVCLIGFGLAARNELTNSSVKGVSTSISPSPTVYVSPTVTPTLTSTPTPTAKPVSNATPVVKTKQYGAWYWQVELNKAQVYIGTDSAGKEIWSDQFPNPTSTPTPKPKSSYSTFGSTSMTSTKAEIKGYSNVEQKTQDISVSR